MDYKYRKNQIFGKRLKVPRNILNNIFNTNLSFKDFIDYQLEDKIPISCLRKEDRKIVEHFGLEKAKTIDWKFIDRHFYYLDESIRDILLTINSN